MADVWAIQVAMYEALTEAPATFPVYDAVPQRAAYPYLVIGELTSAPDDDLDGVDLEDITISLHGWSRSSGKKQAYQMRDWVKSRLNHAAIAGTWAFFEEFATVVEQSSAEGRLYHLVARYRIRTN